MDARIEASEQRWEEYLKQKDIWDKRWDENQKQILANQKSIEEMVKKYETGIGALGARWGIYSEEAFRSGMRGILKDLFDGEVINVTEHDKEGFVFGRPDQVELDVIIKNGVLIICELKSSMSKGEMYLFERKVRFYEQKHQRKATRMVVIAPVVTDRARQVAEELGIEVYSYADSVKK
ncbi:MAG: DUF3782 domain-containing protein [Deltaproteobacteria bacterium]|nr:DUF3782 domain-containing protein [Deltaproteobacteria bacterium]